MTRHAESELQADDEPKVSPGPEAGAAATDTAGGTPKVIWQDLLRLMQEERGGAEEGAPLGF